MDTEKTLDRLREQIRPTLDEFKVEVVELTLKRSSKGLVLRILADKEGGITIDECALINKRLGDIIEDRSLITEGYLLEVSSPGLDRPLKIKRDFEKVLGQEVDVWLTEPLDNKTHFNGKIKKIGEGDLVVETKRDGDVSIPYAVINKAKLNIQHIS